jgi:hypothetical protein
LDNVQTLDEYQKSLTDALGKSSHVDVFLWCVDATQRFTDQEKETLEQFFLMAGDSHREELKRHMILVFTKADDRIESEILSEIGSGQGEGMEYLKRLVGGRWLLGKRLAMPGWQGVPHVVMGGTPRRGRAAEIPSERRQRDRRALANAIIDLTKGRPGFPTSNFKDFIAWTNDQINRIRTLSSQVRRDQLFSSMQSVQRGQLKRDEFMNFVERSMEDDAKELALHAKMCRGLVIATLLGFLSGSPIFSKVADLLVGRDMLSSLPKGFLALAGGTLLFGFEFSLAMQADCGPFGDFSKYDAVWPPGLREAIDSYGQHAILCLALAFLYQIYGTYRQWQEGLHRSLTSEEERRCEDAYYEFREGKDHAVLDKFGSREHRLALWVMVKQHMQAQQNKPGNAFNAFEKFLSIEAGINVTSVVCADLYRRIRPIFVSQQASRTLLALPMHRRLQALAPGPAEEEAEKDEILPTGQDEQGEANEPEIEGSGLGLMCPPADDELTPEGNPAALSCKFRLPLPAAEDSETDQHMPPNENENLIQEASESETDGSIFHLICPSSEDDKLTPEGPPAREADVCEE